MTRGRQSASVGQWVLYIALIIASLALVGYFGFQMYIQDMIRVRASDGYCPTGNWVQVREGIGIPGHTAIIIDTSNTISEEDGARALERIEEWAKDTLRAPFLQKLSVYGLPETEHEAPIQSGKPLCIPKQGEMANILYENPRVVDIEFKIFLNRIREVLDNLRDREEADLSPIAETLATLVAQNPDIDSFVLVSDMLQNSSLWSDYAQEPEMSDKVLAECRRITESGRVRDLYLYYIDRKVAVQSNEWPTDLWRTCLGGINTSTIN